MYNIFQNLRVVLVEPTHPGNIGAVARAMKTMGVRHLVLVNPRSFPHSEAWALAVGADDILEQAQVVSTLAEALAPCAWVVGTSARTRSIPWPLSTPRQAMPSLLSCAATGPVALVFGRESSGLTNEELARCQHHVCIPTDAAYASLNLAQAVQIMVYECFQATEAGIARVQEEEPLAPQSALEDFYAVLEQKLIQARFLRPENPRYLMPRLRRVFSKAALTQQELNMLRGALEALAGSVDGAMGRSVP